MTVVQQEQNVRRYVPWGVAQTLFGRQDPEILMSGPAGTGKSRACLEKMHHVMLSNPNARGLMLRKTLNSLASTGLVTWREHVIPEAEIAGHVKYYGGSAAEAAQYRYLNGSSVTIGGLDKATKIMSSEYDMIYVQEATECSEDDWESLTTRLRNNRVSFQQLLGDSNPNVPTHWLKVRCDRNDCLFLDSRHEDNPILFNGEGAVTSLGASYIARLDRLTGVRKERLRYGRWVAAEGLVYEDYDPQVHIVRDVSIGADWTRWWVVDFGYSNPFVLQCWAEDPDGRLYLYRELYRTQRLVEDHAQDILRVVVKDGEWIEPRPRAIICDWDAEDRATLERHLGMGTHAATKTVSDGIQAVQQRLRIQGDGRPRLYVCADALVEEDPQLREVNKPTCTLEEFPGYIWDHPDKHKEEGKTLKEEPLKKDDHGMDALRYIVAERDLGARPRVRWIR